MQENEMKTFEWNNYIIDKLAIGKGSYSKVYHGYHKITKNEVALKKMAFTKMHNNVKDKVISEINILQKIDHKNIIKLYEYKFDGDYIYIVTEYCNNKDLSKWIINKNTNDQIIDIVKQITNGLEYLHKNNILHRDLKLENILLNNNTIKICDFGFSIIIKENLQLLNTICGTPLFMSPELLYNKPYTIKSEIWSLGIIFYYILYKTHPFGRLDNLAHYRFKIKNEIKFIHIDELDNIIDLTKIMLAFEHNNRPDIVTVVNILNNKMDLLEINNETYLDTELELDLELNETNKNYLEKERINELEDKISKLELIIKEKEMNSSLMSCSCLSTDDNDSPKVTGKGRTNKGYDYSNINTNYFSPPEIEKGINIPYNANRNANKSNSSSRSSSYTGSYLSDSLGSVINFLTKSFSK